MGAAEPAKLQARIRSGRGATYWDYIQLDQLLALPQPRTSFRDEVPFIILHQVAELYFSIVIHELEQLTATADPQEWTLRLPRILEAYRLILQNLTGIARCVGRQEFLEFRKQLSPASGFQSFQFRKIEILSARLYELVAPGMRAVLSPDAPPELLFQHLYWRQAIASDRPESERAMLLEFQARYDDTLLALAHAYEERNVAARFAAFSHDLRERAQLVKLLRAFDDAANRAWPEAHFRLAMAMLGHNEPSLGSTGGTSWQTYLPSSHRGIRFFPLLTADRNSDRPEPS